MVLGVTNKFGKLKKLGAFKASLRLLQDPNASPKRKAAIIGASVLGILYVIFPEATDLIPILGWLDEALVAIIVRYALAWLAKQYRTIEDAQP
jgi:uncharacterized membrane protein YkvA (DUF1232 family)